MEEMALFLITVMFLNAEASVPGDFGDESLADENLDVARTVAQAVNKLRGENL
jgi:hypothetical protein